MFVLRAFFLILFFRGCHLHHHQLNFCRTNEGYINYESQHCSYNPTIGANAIELITSNGYQYTIHTTITYDGYILNFFRIFRDFNTIGDRVIYFQHGLMSDAGNFLADPSSLAFQLLQNGCDVFLGNSRGTPYSREHINASISNEDYWNFSFEEIAVFDVPAILEEISKITNTNSILYLGNSMGGAISAIYATEYKDHAKKYVRAFINVAPVVYFEKYESPVWYLAEYLDIFRGIIDYSKMYVFNDRKFLQPYLIKFCSSYPTVIACTKMLEFTLGNSSISGLSDIVPVLASQLSSASMKSIYHYLQILKSKGKFSKYDYGRKKNYALYGINEPPEYNISNIDIPMYIFYSIHDLLATEESVKRLYNTISSVKKELVRIPEDDSIIFNHHDFWSSDNVEEFFHKSVMKLINRLYN